LPLLHQQTAAQDVRFRQLRVGLQGGIGHFLGTFELA